MLRGNCVKWYRISDFLHKGLFLKWDGNAIPTIVLRAFLGVSHPEFPHWGKRHSRCRLVPPRGYPSKSSKGKSGSGHHNPGLILANQGRSPQCAFSCSKILTEVISRLWVTLTLTVRTCGIMSFGCVQVEVVSVGSPKRRDADTTTERLTRVPILRKGAAKWVSPKALQILSRDLPSMSEEVDAVQTARCLAANRSSPFDSWIFIRANIARIERTGEKHERQNLGIPMHSKQELLTANVFPHTALPPANRNLCSARCNPPGSPCWSPFCGGRWPKDDKFG
jgi:hypothetical protein